MADIKWLKITNTMFEDEKIEYLESLPDGDALINIWVKTLCLASKCNERGYLVFANEIPYTFDLLAIKFKKTVKQIEYAYSLFSKLGMLSYENDIFSISNWAKYQNIDGCEAIKEYNKLKQQEYRAKKKILEIEDKKGVNDKSMTNVKKDSISNSISNSNTLDINNNIKEEEKEIYKEKATRFLAPTIDEVKAYCLERNNNVDAERFVDFYSSKGWIVGKTKMRDWKACVRTWEKNNFSKCSQKGITDDWQELYEEERQRKEQL